MTELPRCITLRLRIDELERDLADPDLAARLSAGWTVATSMVVEDGRTAYLLIVLAPPRPSSRWSHPAVPLVTVLLGSLLGAILGGLLS